MNGFTFQECDGDEYPEVLHAIEAVPTNMALVDTFGAYPRRDPNT